MKVGHIRLAEDLPHGGPAKGSWGTVGMTTTVGDEHGRLGVMTFYVAIFDHPTAMAAKLPRGTWIVCEDEIAEKRECTPTDGICSDETKP